MIKEDLRCPHCNKKVFLSPLQGLKRHIELQISNLKSCYAVMEDTERNKVRCKHKKSTIDKWKSWLKAIENLEKGKQDV